MIKITFKEEGNGGGAVVDVNGEIKAMFALNSAIKSLQEVRDNNYRKFRESDYEELTEEEKREMAFEENRRMEDFCSNYEKFKKFIFEGKMKMK